MWQICELTTEYTRSLAECHIACWREAYRGVVPDHVLDAFDVDRRAQQWERILATSPTTTYVAVHDGEVIGFSGAGPTREPDAPSDLELYALYVRRSHYGSGLAHALLDVAIGSRACLLWVLEENSRAQAFYRKHAFVLDGMHKMEHFSDVVEVRMVRDTVTG